uniref:DUF5641 domain-containing protein n=1 Tax=Heligmosomoides polygyrus TaxID=6339 RepID=A0A8L8K713_HELPZ
LSEDEDTKVSEHIDNALSLISRTEEFLSNLAERKEQIPTARGTEGLTEYRMPIAKFELPQIPIPEFSGKCWEWDNFWELFNSTVHSQPLSNLQKFNYLRRCLKGEALESISRFQVSSSNYELAIERLTEKYGRSSEIVQFGYVDTKWNPADIATRGISPKSFTDHIWWTGYSLNDIRHGNFVSSQFQLPEDDGEDEPLEVIQNSSTTTECDQVEEIVDWTAFNSYRRVRRVVAYAARFLRGIFTNLQEPLKAKLQETLSWMAQPVQQKYLSASEIKTADRILVRNHQMVHIKNQYKRNLMKSLNIERDEHNILRALQTEMQTRNALKSSQLLTEKYWSIWRNHYLTSLREHHRRFIDNKRGCTKQPCEGEIVLVSDSSQKRNLWKLARIMKLIKSGDGEIREAEISCGKHILRRPVNQLYPLEIQGNEVKDLETQEEEQQAERSRESSPPIQKVIKIPPEELLFDYEARWKLRYQEEHMIVIKSCPAQSFCSTIDCTICFVNILNPECWPFHAIIGAGIVLYLIIALTYTICYVPVTVGRPFRLLCEGCCCGIYLIAYMLWTCVRSTIRSLRRRRPASRILEALAIIGLINTVIACQTVNIFSHHLHSCRTSSGKTLCKVEMASVLKINPYKKDACFRIQRNESTIMEIRMFWDQLYLLCEERSITYTRNVKQKVVDSKRCPHMGSCKDNKCADVNRTSLLPELTLGNQYPGNTDCFESCGGPGCDCFYLSSGCLFYRTYAVPTDSKIYEVFTCHRWREEVKVHMQIKRTNIKRISSYVLALQPNVPVSVSKSTLTLSVLGIPPLNELDTHFIRTNNTVALWNKEEHLILQCPTFEDARNLQCSMDDTCKCSPAEFQVSCRCEDHDLSKYLEDIGNILPVTRASVNFGTYGRSTVKAQLDQGVTAELILNINEDVDAITMDSTDEVCIVDDTSIFGCYSCSKGAVAEIKCRSSKEETTAEIDCVSETFTVSCSPAGHISKLRFLLSTAQAQLKCTVKCGSQSAKFQITGILKYVHTVSSSWNHALQSQHNSTSDFQWPDFHHITSIYILWYKTVIITLLLVGGALLFSYMFLISACRSVLWICMKAILKSTACGIRICFRIIFWTLQLCRPKHGKTALLAQKDA